MCAIIAYNISMPELPEVETVKRGLQSLLIGHTVKAVESDWPKSFPNAPADVQQFLIGAQVVAVERRAKVLLIELSSKYSLVIHLKMTGQLVYVASQQIEDRRLKTEGSSQPSALSPQSIEPEVRFGAGHPNESLIGKLPDKSTRVKLTLDGAKLFFNDQRKFGWVRLLPTAEVSTIDFMQKVGPEPLSQAFTHEMFHERLQKRKNTSIKAALLDQTVLAGIGNIYADESLFAAHIHPETKVRELTKKQTKILRQELQAVLTLAIEKGGSTDKNYVNAEGKKGSYMSFAQVFRREGQACPRCGCEIIKLKVAGRGTHICPKCQKK
jgi:formamidopyrimidine-DNA glycosylase